jgi:hypothetical protein
VGDVASLLTIEDEMAYHGLVFRTAERRRVSCSNCGQTMQTGPEYRNLVAKLVNSHPPNPNAKGRFHESWDTMILGTASTAIGFSLLLVVLSGINGRQLGGWHDERPTMRRGVDSPVPFLFPSRLCAFAAVGGECLGFAGILVGLLRRATTSLVCVVGIVVCLSQMIVFCAYALVFT